MFLLGDGGVALALAASGAIYYADASCGVDAGKLDCCGVEPDGEISSDGELVEVGDEVIVEGEVKSVRK